MIGAKELIADRLSGYRPEMVFVDLDLPTRLVMLGNIQVEASDRLSSMDLRGVHGLVVSVSGLDPERTRLIAKVCTDAGAVRVITAVSTQIANGEFRMLEVIDTEGVLSWKK